MYDVFDMLTMGDRVNPHRTQKAKTLPYNFYQDGENEYVMEMAVAGFNKDDIEITRDKNTLTISGKTPDDSKERNYFYRGIARRNFDSTFKIGQNTVVNGAEINDGLLKVYLEEQVPEKDKPLQIEIK